MNKELCLIKGAFPLNGQKLLVYAVYPEECGGILEFTLSAEETDPYHGDLTRWQITKILAFLEEYNQIVAVSVGDNCTLISFNLINFEGKEVPVKLCAYEDHTCLFVKDIPYSSGNICLDIAKQEERKKAYVI